MRSFLTMLVLLFVVVMCTCNAEAASLADAYRTIHASLVFIRADATTGTGFVVASDAKFSYVVTAEHVVHGAKKISAFANDDYALPFEAKVLKSDPRNDIAVLRFARSNLTPVILGAAPAEGVAIGATGYPRTSLAFLESSRELRPQLSPGVITAVRGNGVIVQHNAHTDKGQSGGPVFTVEGVEVVGVVRGTLHGDEIAAGSSAVQALLTAAGIQPNVTPALAAGIVHRATDLSANSQLLHDAPGARTVCLWYSVEGDWKIAPAANESPPNTSGMPNAMVAAVEQKLSALFDGANVHAQVVSSGDVNTMVNDLRNGTCVGGVRLSARWSARKTGFFEEGGAENLALNLADYRGNIWYSAAKSREHKRMAVGVSDVSQNLRELAEGEIDAMTAFFGQYGDGTAANFARYGIPIGRGERRAFFVLAPDIAGARITDIVRLGTAARAGLQKSDLVVTINGKSTAGMSATDLTLATTKLQEFDAVVRQGDGRDVHVRFVPQDLRWYVQNQVGKSAGQ